MAKESCTEEVESTYERSVLRSEKLDWQSHLSPLISDKELQDFGGCPAGFPSCFGPVFPYYDLIPPFGLVMYILCHSMSEDVVGNFKKWTSTFLHLCQQLSALLRSRQLCFCPSTLWWSWRSWVPFAAMPAPSNSYPPCGQKPGRNKTLETYN